MHELEDLWQCTEAVEGNEEAPSEKWTNHDWEMYPPCKDAGWQEESEEVYRPRWLGSGRWSAESSGRSHCEVPKRHDFASHFKTLRNKASPVTTLMIRNVPNFFKQKKLMQELDRLGFEGKYDFLYLPIDTSTLWNVGYAFVNFEDPQQAKTCMEVIQGYDFGLRQPNKRRPAQVSVAHIQGLADNLAHCTSTAMFASSQPWMRPWVKNWTWAGTAWQQLQHRPRNFEDYTGSKEMSGSHDLDETVSELSMSSSKTSSPSSWWSGTR